MEVFNTVVSIVSLITGLILSGFAIWLSFVFYDKGKGTEKNVNEALTEIKTHTAALERLTGKWMDRLTKHVTSPQPADETTTKLLELISITYTGVGSKMSTPTQEESKKQLMGQLVSTHIAILYYSGLTNVATQGHLPVEQVDGDGIRGIVDTSQSDYQYILSVLNDVPEAELKANPLYHLYEKAAELKDTIKTSAVVYEERTVSN